MADDFSENPNSGYREPRPSPIRRDANEPQWNERDENRPAKRRRTGYYSPTQDERTSAMLCHLLAIPLGLIGALVMWLVKKDESRFCDYHGREALNFSLNITAYVLASVAILTIIAVVTCGMGVFLYPLLLCIPIYALVMHIIALTAANRGEWHRYPLIVRVISPPEGLDSVPPSTGVLTDVDDDRDFGAAAPTGEPRKASLLWLWILCGVFAFLILSGGCFGGLGYFVFRSAKVRSTTPAVAVNPTPGWPANPGPARNDPAADRPDVAADPVEQALKDLKSDDRFKRVRAADALARQTSDPARHDEVIAALQKLLHDGDQSAQAAASRGLVAWATTESDVPVLLETYKVANFVDKKRIVERFGKLKDQSTVKTLVGAVRDISLRSAAEQALKGFGPEAEDEVAVLLSDGNFPTRQSACNIMKEMGTKKSLPALDAAAKDKNRFVAKAAQDAIAAIKARNP